MKLIVAILSDNDNEPVSQALIQSGFRVTRIASTGGFFRRGSSTVMIGVEDNKVDEALEIIRKNVSPVVEAVTQRATMFVLNVENFSQI